MMINTENMPSARGAHRLVTGTYRDGGFRGIAWLIVQCLLTVFVVFPLYVLVMVWDPDAIRSYPSEKSQEPRR